MDFTQVTSIGRGRRPHSPPPFTQGTVSTVGEERVRTAYNEAGHTVYAWQQDRAVWSCTIVPGTGPDGDYLGLTDCADVDPWPTTELYVRYLIGGLAGEVIGGERRGYEVNLNLNSDTQHSARLLWIDDGQPGNGTDEEALTYIERALVSFSDTLVALRADERLESVVSRLLEAEELDYEALEALRWVIGTEQH